MWDNKSPENRDENSTRKRAPRSERFIVVLIVVDHYSREKFNLKTFFFFLSSSISRALLLVLTFPEKFFKVYAREVWCLYTKHFLFELAVFVPFEYSRRSMRECVLCWILTVSRVKTRHAANKKVACLSRQADDFYFFLNKK